jgi:hypothetical protein
MDRVSVWDLVEDKSTMAMVGEITAHLLRRYPLGTIVEWRDGREPAKWQTESGHPGVICHVVHGYNRSLEAEERVVPTDTTDGVLGRIDQKLKHYGAR